MATPKEFSVEQNSSKPVVSAYGRDALGQIPSSLAERRQKEVNSLTTEERKVWNPLAERHSSTSRKIEKVSEICRQSEEIGNEANLSAGLLNYMALEVVGAPVISELKQFSQENKMRYNVACFEIDETIAKLLHSASVGPLSIAEFLKNGGKPEMVKKSLGMLVDAQINGDVPQDRSDVNLKIFEARRIVRAGMLAARSEEFLFGNDSRLPRSMEIKDTIEKFVESIKKTQKNTRAVLLDSDEEDVKNEFSRLFERENASVLTYHVLGFDDGPEALLFHKQIQKIARETGKNTEFYGKLSEDVLEYIERNDPDSLCILEDIVSDKSKGESKTVGARIEEADFENAIVAVFNSKTPTLEVIRPQDSLGVPSPEDITFTMDSEAVVVDLVWEIGQSTHKVAIRLDRKSQTIDWSILNDIDSLGVGPAREAILSYLLGALNLTADSVRPKKQEEKQEVVVPQKPEAHWVRNDNKVNHEKESVHPQVKIDCPIEMDLRQVEAIILANNIKTIHGKKVLEALREWNMGRRRMLRRTDDGSFVLSVGKVTVILQEVGDALSIVDINSSK